jgi:hypothetical protein
MIDLLAILPYYIELMVRADTVSLILLSYEARSLSHVVHSFPILHSANVSIVKGLQTFPL